MDIISYDSKKLPITKYDFFAYFIPGMVFLASIFFYEYLINFFFKTETENKHLLFYQFIKFQSPFLLEKTPWITPIIIAFVDFILIYTIGHIISSVSSLIIDRTLIYKIYGYPYEILLSQHKNNKFNYGLDVNSRFSPQRKNPISSSFYKILFFYTNAGFIIFFINMEINDRVQFHLNYPNLWWIFIAIFLAIMIIYRICFKVRKKNYPLFKRKHKVLFCIYFILLPFPYNVISWFFSRVISTKRGFSKIFIEKYKELFRQKFANLEPEEQETNNFWLPYCYIIEKSNKHSAMLINWLSLYSFARNLATSFYLVFIYILSFRLLGIYSFNNINISNYIFVNWYPIIFFALSILMLVRYYYLYVNYYSKFLFRSFVTLAILENNKKNPDENLSGGFE